MIVQDSLFDQLIRESFAQTTRQQQLDAGAMPVEQLLVPTNHRGPATFAQLLSRTPRFYLQENVVEAIQRIYRRAATDPTYLERQRAIIARRPELILPPFLKTLFEFQWTNAETGQRSRIGLNITNADRLQQIRGIKQIFAQAEISLNRKLDEHLKMAVAKQALDDPEKLKLTFEAASRAAAVATDMFQNPYVVAHFYMRTDTGIVPDFRQSHKAVAIYFTKTGNIYVDARGPHYAEKLTLIDLNAAALLIQCTLMLLNSRTPILDVEEAKIEPF